MKLQEENKVAIFRSLVGENEQLNHYSGAYPYKDIEGSIVESTVLNPIYSYARNYTKFDLEFSLFIWTTEDDMNKIRKHFDIVSKNITKKQILPYLNVNSMSYEYVGDAYRKEK